MLNTLLVENNMFNTLAFSKKMQNVGMTQIVAEELAITLFNLHLNQFENLLTKKEFSRFEGEIKKEIDGVKYEIDGVKKEIDGVKHEIDGVKREIDGVKREIDGVKKEIDGVKHEMKNFVTKKEFYAETKNLSLNLTIKMGIIMTAGIGVLSLILKL